MISYVFMGLLTVTVLCTALLLRKQTKLTKKLESYPGYL